MRGSDSASRCGASRWGWRQPVLCGGICPGACPNRRRAPLPPPDPNFFRRKTAAMAVLVFEAGAPNWPPEQSNTSFGAPCIERGGLVSSFLGSGDSRLFCFWGLCGRGHLFRIPPNTEPLEKLIAKSQEKHRKNGKGTRCP